MYGRIHKLRNAVFGVGMVAALGFGATQALAAPELSQKSARHCNPAACDAACKAYGFTGGVCLAHNKQCVCYY